jgi:two-component system nitrogen regulation sensor histidine kinase NtrY
VNKRLDVLILFLGLGLLLGGFISLFAVDQPAGNQYKILIQRQITESIAKARDQQTPIFPLLDKKAGFPDFPLATKYPYYVYLGDSLVFWSSNKFTPEPRVGLRKQEENYIEYNKNKGLLVRTPHRTPHGRYEVISLVTLYENSIDPAISSGFEYGIFRNLAADISVQAVAGTYQIKDSAHRPLLYVLPVDRPDLPAFQASTFTRIVFSLGLVLLGFFAAWRINRLYKSNRYLPAALWLLVSALILRSLMKWLGLPWALMPEDLVPRYLMVPPRFGDMILSAFLITLVLAVFALWQLEVIAYATVRRMSSRLRSVLSVSMIVLAVLTAFLCYLQVLKIYSNQTIGLNYSLKLTSVKLGTYVFLFALFSIFFLGSHIVINFYKRLQPRFKMGLFHWLYGTILSGMLFYYLDIELWTWLIAVLYVLWTYTLKLPRYFYILRFKTFIYFLSGAFAFTFLLFSLVKKQDDQKNEGDKNYFATKLLQQKDLKAEVLLNQFSNMVQNDTNLANLLEKPILAASSINYTIKDSLLSPYFDVYQVNVQAYSTSGRPLGNDSVASLSNVYARYATAANKTEYEGLFYHKGDTNQYILFSEIVKKGIVRGVLCIQVSYLTSDLIKTAERLPESSILNQPGMPASSYALYDKNFKLIYKEGAFDYQELFDPKVFAGKNTAEQRQGQKVFQHTLFTDKEGNLALISQPDDFYQEILSGFSYLFLIALLGTVVLLTLLGLLSGFRMYKMSFSSKIQFFLNMAFLVPLTIIIMLTLGVVITSFISLQNRSLQENAQNVANTVTVLYQNYIQGKSTAAYFEEQLSNLALSSEYEICLFNLKGRLRFTSMSAIYLTYQLSDRMNPQAYASILNEKNRPILIEDYLGSKKFKIVYLSGSVSNGTPYGLMGVAYPDADLNLQQQIKEVVAAILIIFLVMFFILLALSYTASTNLTAPLKLIASKLKKTNLNAKNEEIFWKSNDEIGLLTNEYNRMIKKLEESREALSSSEKQTAWREMAKQVAHEIKNPLTPMKLSIQQLLRTLPADSDETRKKIDRALGSINEQIDNISEIANSFSEFAKMPVPRKEIFDLVSVVENTVYLYTQSNHIYIKFETDSPQIFVSGDKMILTRAVTNLIINGIQSVPPSRKPIIQVTVTDKGEMGMVEVKDNGVGINEELRKKVFIPNFTTKLGGSGLGLSMAKRGIEHAGGNIWFDSVEGEGTTFYLDLPKSKLFT